MKPRTAAIESVAHGALGSEVRPGDVLAGKYRVESVLGRGGMGLVLAATHLQLGQRVAIKMLLPETLHNADLVARFSQEARATVKIQSEHVVRVLDVGALPGGVPYLVMEYLDGRDLAHVVAARGPLPVGEAVDYVLQACEALAEAHRAGIVHRDLKPANLFLIARSDGSPLVKVLDFGISKATLSSGLGSPSLTQTSAVIGSPNYMSPEQLKSSKDVDARTDVWSLGLVLYELLTGRVAFQAETLVELHVAILQSFPAPLRTQRPDAPPSLEMVILRCLHKDAAYRYANVAELALALAEHAPQRSLVSVERACGVLGVAFQPPVVSPSQPSPGQPQPASSQQGYSYASPGHPSQLPHGSQVLRTPPSSAAGPAAGHGGSPGYAQQPGYGVAPGGALAPLPTAASGQGGWAPAGAPARVQPPLPMLGYGQPNLAPPVPWGNTSAPQAWPTESSAMASPNRGPSLAAVLLVVLVACIVLGLGGCMMCVCVGALA